jgi:hypothetical protein
VAHVNRRGPQDDALWTSENPTYGVVRAVMFDGPYAGRLDDLNGDYREVCLTIFRGNGSTWEEWLYADDTGYPDVGDTTSYGWSNGHAFVAGRDRPGVRVTVLLRNDPHTVQADADGWWLFVRPAEPPTSHESMTRSYLSREKD